MSGDALLNFLSQSFLTFKVVAKVRQQHFGVLETSNDENNGVGYYLYVGDTYNKKKLSCIYDQFFHLLACSTPKRRKN